MKVKLNKLTPLKIIRKNKAKRENNDALIDGISLKNNLKIRNGDGIDLDHSRKVRIANCFIESGDDCICLKNRREFEEYGPCQDIVVTNCKGIEATNENSCSHHIYVLSCSDPCRPLT